MQVMTTSYFSHPGQAVVITLVTPSSIGVTLSKGLTRSSSCSSSGSSVTSVARLTDRLKPLGLTGAWGFAGIRSRMGRFSRCISVGRTSQALVIEATLVVGPRFQELLHIQVLTVPLGEEGGPWWTDLGCSWRRRGPAP
jgi:hypothetical protein